MAARGSSRHNDAMAHTDPDAAGELLRARGLRSTPQRRTILGAFRGGRTEHLSADEVYARAVQALSEISRATVYATLAEFSELGLVAAFGTPEPVRYETTVAPHAHLRCYLCLRLFDLPGAQQEPADVVAPGFIVMRVETRAEGVCDECVDYESGLAAGAKSMLRPPAARSSTLDLSGVAASTLETPLGPLAIAATPQGLVRVAFEDHQDAQVLHDYASSRRGGKAAQQHLAVAREDVLRYFAEGAAAMNCVVDWDSLSAASEALRASQMIPFGDHRSYTGLDVDISPRALGLAYGSNPIPIIAPCHRVTRGTEVPASYVGGLERRQWLEAHEAA